MFSVRLFLCLVLILLVQVESNNNYIRGERVSPASRVTQRNNDRTWKNGPENKNNSNERNEDMLEFQTVKRLTGSKPIKEGSRPNAAQWF